MYIADRRYNQLLLNVAQRNQNLCAAQDNSYHIALLHPGEYLVFGDPAGRDIVWPYDELRPELNRVHLSNRLYDFNGQVYNQVQGSQRIRSLHVVLNRANHVTAVMNPQGDVQFVEDCHLQPIVLRQPWRYLQDFAQNTNQTIVNGGGGNPQVERLMLGSAQWAVATRQDGKVEVLPPLLTGRPYSLYRP